MVESKNEGQDKCKACDEPLTEDNIHWDEREYCIACGEGLQKEQE